MIHLYIFLFIIYMVRKHLNRKGGKMTRQKINPYQRKVAASVALQYKIEARELGLNVSGYIAWLKKRAHYSTIYDDLASGPSLGPEAQPEPQPQPEPEAKGSGKAESSNDVVQ